jgi:hypothetical protein
VTIITYALYWQMMFILLQCLAHKNGFVTEKKVDRYVFYMKIETSITLITYFFTFVW